jgi:hypothetical protein
MAPKAYNASDKARIAAAIVEVGLTAEDEWILARLRVIDHIWYKTDEDETDAAIMLKRERIRRRVYFPQFGLREARYA